MSCGDDADADYIGYVREMLGNGKKDIYVGVIRIVDQHVIKLVLEHAKGNRTLAAEILGMSRLTLRRKLRTLGLDSIGGP